MGNGLCEQKGRVKMYLAKDDRYESMLYNRSGKSGLKLPAMSLGLWHNFGGESNYENMKRGGKLRQDAGSGFEALQG